MIGQEPPGGRGLVRRVFGSLFGPMARPAPQAGDVDERILVAGEILALQLANRPGSGFTGLVNDELTETAQLLCWQRWRWETGRLSDGEVRQ